jgi:hypothetical protein
MFFVHAFVSHVELFWELPSYGRFLRELTSWGRAIGGGLTGCEIVH